MACRFGCLNQSSNSCGYRTDRAGYPDSREYSWRVRTGDGYRYDHAFCSVGLAPTLVACDYVHEPRTSRLSDHPGLTDTAIREVAEETGIVLETLSPCVWVRETRFRYRNQAHHRREHVFLARPTDTTPSTHTTPTTNERAGLLGQQWWSHPALLGCHDKLLPPALPALLDDILAGQFTPPATLYQ